MNMFMKFAVVVFAFAASAFADETFGGIGVVYRMSKVGAEVQEVIPGSPVAETKVKAGDVIIAIDGVSVRGRRTGEVRNALRGVENKPVVLTYVSNGDTLVETVRRVKLTVKRLDNVADADQPEKKLLAVLDDGKIVENAEAPVSGNLEGVYIDAASVPSVGDYRARVESRAKLVSFNRSLIRVKLESAGAFAVSVIDSNGDVVRLVTENHGHAGINSVFWDGLLVPDGHYAISIEQNGIASGVNILLK